jgi:hypothetical protein
MNQTLYLGCESGLDVMTWQKVLVQAKLLTEADVDCQFGPYTEQTTIEWQRRHGYDKDEADGVVRPIMWQMAIPALAVKAAADAAKHKVSRIAEGAIGVASTLLKIREKGNNRGAAVDAMNKDTGTYDGAPWCMSFVQSCFRLSANLQTPKLRDTLKPDTASCFYLLEHLSDGPCTRIPATDGRRGDVPIFKFSHTGIAITNYGDGWYETIEGNTGAKGEREGKSVERKRRHHTEIRAFIRVPDQEIG